jgi:hypothetical protein
MCTTFPCGAAAPSAIGRARHEGERKRSHESAEKQTVNHADTVADPEPIGAHSIFGNTPPKSGRWYRRNGTRARQRIARWSPEQPAFVSSPWRARRTRINVPENAIRLF